MKFWMGVSHLKLRITLLLLASASVLNGASNIDNAVPNKHSWQENVGWMNWRDANSAAAGVNVAGLIMSGFIWCENIGWINAGSGIPGGTGGFYANLNGADFGINIDADGDLHGYAWGENVGWINLDGGAMATPVQPARIDCAGRLSGYAWSENIGWVNLSVAVAGQFVAVQSSFVPLLCDANHDGTTDGRDVQVFVRVLLTPASADWRDVCSGDVDSPADGEIDINDVTAFVACLLS